ncbi:hypothetical protein BU16DRAFT_115400 [Lophium mytilinum]|uniref:Uncharacterized protein n=1 Tax=Lophium mytilinum TaxID=390894 RepID=A0A6A6QJS0_9PEZI|nr:hypothetical protein BU16DRAFT_115400 [Lophium mytilinum]
MSTSSSRACRIYCCPSPSTANRPSTPVSYVTHPRVDPFTPPVASPLLRRTFKLGIHGRENASIQNTTLS